MQSAVLPPSAWRLILGFIIGPGISALIFAAVSPLDEGLPNLSNRIWQTFVVVLWVVYPVTLIFGLPLYFFLKRRVRPSMLNCGLSGAAVSALPWVVLGLLATPDEASTGNTITVYNHMRTLAGWFEFFQLVGGMAMLGVIAGVVFWLCVAIGPKPRLDAA